MALCLLPHPHPASSLKGEERRHSRGQIQSNPPAHSSPLRGRLGGGGAQYMETPNEQ
jgi:hypothetical protein